jgi:hypothetical protein
MLGPFNDPITSVRFLQVTLHRSLKVVQIRLKDAAAVSDDALAETMLKLKHPAFFIRRDHKR